jgi:hypothetical protein
VQHYLFEFLLQYATDCKREFEYASTLQKPMIFVMLDETFTTVSSPDRVDGDVGFILGGKLWYGLFSDANMSRAVADVSAKILSPVAAPRLVSQFSAAVAAPPAAAMAVTPGSAYGAMPFISGSPVSGNGYGGLPMLSGAASQITAEGVWSSAIISSYLPFATSLPWRVISEMLVDVFNQVGQCGGTRRPLLLADVNTFCVQWRSAPLCTSDKDSGHWVISKQSFLVFFEWFKSCAVLCSKMPATWNTMLPDPSAPQKEAPAFRGFVTAYQSAALLQGCPVGTFLLRFSESSASTVTLSRVADASGRVEHNKIAYVESGHSGAFVVDGQAGQSYSSIEEFILTCPLISSVAPNHDKRHVFSFAPAPVLAAAATATTPTSPFQNANVHGAWMKATNNHRSLRMLPPSPLFDGSPLPWDIVSAVLIDEFNAASQCAATRPVTRIDIDKFRDVWARKPLCARDQFGGTTLAPAAFSEFCLWLVSCAQLCVIMPKTWSSFVTSSQGVATPIFIGFATAVESETLLNGHQSGTFLLRFSETSHSTVTLTRVVDNFGRKEHNKIAFAGGCFSFDTPGSTPCQTLEECVLNCGLISHVFPGVDKRQVFVVSAPAPAPAPALQHAATTGNPMYGTMAAIPASLSVAAGNPVYGIMAASLNHASSVAPVANPAYGIMGAGAILAPPFTFQTRAAHDAWSLATTRAASQSGMPLAPRAPLPWLVIREVLVESFNAAGQCSNAHPIVADDVDKFCIEWAQKPMCTRNAKSLLVLTDEAFSEFFEWFISCADLVRRCPESWGRFVPASQGSAAQVPVILGFLTGAEANGRLQGQPAGTFLLRFSERAKSTITVSRVDSSGRLEHNRIVYTAGAQGGRFAFDGQGSVQYPTLEECVLKCTVITHVWPGYEKTGVFCMVADAPL